MKKIILLILTTFIGLFVFGFNVKALNSDATATCIYTIPDISIFKSATFAYEKNDLEKTCLSNSLASGQLFTCNMSSDLTAAYFVDKKTDKVYCPTLYYYYRAAGTVGTGGASYEVKISPIEFKASFWEGIGAIISTGKMTLSTSKLIQGSIPITEENKTENLQCICGGILIKHGSLTFGSIYDNYTPDYAFQKFDLNTFKDCPDAIYYKITSSNVWDITKTVVKISDVEFDKAQGTACATTEDAAGWHGSSGNDTDYKPQEDVIADFCTETSRLWKMVGYFVMALKILVPVIIIVMGSLDLGKAVVANSEDEMKKATQVLIKRIIAGIIIFFIPTIINLVLKLASNYVSVVDSSSNCIECVSKPGGC